ncbi:MAG: HNH endonuclease [Candidatus Krumholzibacteriota bacterium]
MKITPFAPNKSARFADAALKKSVDAVEQAQQCAVLWFSEIMHRRLYRKLGYASINQYALVELKFSKTRTGDFVQLARRLEQLPEVRESVAMGKLGYTKAREIVKVATPETELGWVEEAEASSRRELERKVADARSRARRKAKASPGQAELVPDEKQGNIPAASVPVRLSVEMTPEQFARYEVMLEKLHLQGPVGSRAEMLLEAMAELVAAGNVSDEEKAPRGALTNGPAFQVHVHRCPDCGQASVPTSKGELIVEKEVIERASCDSRIRTPGRRNTATIPPTTRMMVLARDRHRCRTAGCGHTKFLEVHHVEPRACGGSNRPENLITLCSACHRLWHEKPEAMAAMAEA